MTAVDELRTLSEAATPGPWRATTEGSYDQRHAAAKAFIGVMATRGPDGERLPYSDLTWIRDAEDFANVSLVGNGPKATDNAAFIVAAVNFVRSQLAEISPHEQAAIDRRVREMAES